MEQEIRFCTTRDGVSIAYATVGEGPPVVKAANWLTHLEYDWQSPVWRHWFTELARDHRLVRYDERGCGLSDWVVEDFSFDAWVKDFETVVDTLGLERFPILGISQGGPVAIEYAARHPERVSRLVLHGSYAQGWNRRGLSPERREEVEAVLTLTREGWGKDSPAYRQIFTLELVPDATPEQMRWVNDLQRLTTSPENAVRFMKAFGEIDVRDRLPALEVPTLVLHSRRDAMVPFNEGRRLASQIPDARFVPLETQNHILLESEPAWLTFLDEVRRFLGVSRREPTASRARVPSVRWMGHAGRDADERREARALLSSIDRLSLARFTVVGHYRKYEEQVRNALTDLCRRIAGALQGSLAARENYLIWASPGSGKTYLVRQLAASLPDSVVYEELNLAEAGQREVARSLGGLEGVDGPGLCLVDEVDARATEDWPYEVLLPQLDANVERGKRLVFVLAGSSGSSLDELKERMASRPKGTDLLSRIPDGHEVDVPPPSVGDRLLVASSHLLEESRARGDPIRAVEKLALYFVAMNPRLRNARQIREVAVRTVGRLPPGEDRVKYDHLFEPGDPENKRFWMDAMPVAEDLANAFVTVEP